MPPTDPARERTRISTAYFLYFATVGLYLPYFSAYLRARGLPAAEIGWLLSLGPLLRGLFPPAFGFLADRVRGPHFWNVVTAWGMTAGIALMAIEGNMLWLVVGSALFYTSISATIPLLDATALHHLAQRPGRFGRIRLWGSIGFIVTSFGLGTLYPDMPPETIIISLIASYALFALFVSTNRMAGATPEKPALRDVGALLKIRSLLVVLAGLFLNRLASAPFVGFYTIFVQDVGLGGDVVAWTWGIAVTVEVVLMLFIDRLIDRFGAVPVVAAGFLLEALRWFAYASFDSKTALLLLAPGHGIAFTMGYVAMVRHVMESVPARLRATGQGLAAAATGLGQTAGIIVTGYIHDGYGNQTMWLVAGVVGLLAVATVIYPRPRPATS